MGDAKRRGTEAERKDKAMREGNATAFGVMKSGAAPHYAFILDRSPKAVHALSELKNGPAELKARFNSAVVKFWEDSHFPFVVVWGTWGMTGGLTLPCLDVDNLINKALPVVMQRTEEKGEMCAFVPAVDDDLLLQVQAKIAELQPAVGPSDLPQ